MFLSSLLCLPFSLYQMNSSLQVVGSYCELFKGTSWFVTTIHFRDECGNVLSIYNSSRLLLTTHLITTNNTIIRIPSFYEVINPNRTSANIHFSLETVYYFIHSFIH